MILERNVNGEIGDWMGQIGVHWDGPRRLDRKLTSAQDYHSVQVRPGRDRFPQKNINVGHWNQAVGGKQSQERLMGLV